MATPADGGARQRTDSLRTATYWRFAYLLIQGGSGALAFIVLARVLDRQELGAAATALALSVTVQVLADFGLSQVATSEVPRAAAADGDAAGVAGALARLFLRAGLVATGVVLVGAAVVPEEARLAVVAAAPAAGAALLVTGAESLARALGDPRRQVVLVLANRLTFFPLIAFGVILIDNMTAWQAMAFYSAGAWVGGLIAAADLVRLRRAARAAAGLVRSAVVLGAAGVIAAVATRVNVLVLSVAGTLVEVGRFEAAWRAFQPLIYVAGALGTAAAPFAAHALASGAGLRPVVMRGLKLSLAVGLAGAVGLFFLADLAVLVLYGERDDGAAAASRWLAAALPMALTAFYIQAAILVPARRGPLLVRAAVAECVITLVGTALVADAHGAEGAAAVFALSQLVYVVVLSFAARQYLVSGPARPSLEPS